ncbi:ABC transporter ATP-binding protein [Peribacillus asahii]|uniref:ABC transporter ATP-binding protein n=1 Tax=Peribacillus asahii TaxID=228899 RepID=A0A3Q9RGV3_9BACI|nr:ABC transporter ATP-binding protein [Peribacillus asahii]AZV41243.1 ABC transporter ATP-binding protein [Peribacillus asahii]USK85612.1 ABC transporter ATP-binding protein/permease [Peribacillus asahii]
MIKLFKYLKPYQLFIGLALFFLFVELGVELVQPLLMAKIIDEGIMQKDLSVVVFWGSIMMGMALFSFFGGIVNSFAASHVAQSFGYDVRKRLFEKVQAFSFSNLNKFAASSLITRLTNDVTMIQSTVFMGLRIMLRAPLMVIGGGVMALFVHVQLALILVIMIPVLVFFLVWMMKRAMRLFKGVQERLDQVNSVIRENLMGMRVIKVFLRKNHEVKRFATASDELKEKTTVSLRFIETTIPVLMLVMNGGILFIIWLGSEYISTGDIQVGEVVAIVNYAMRITASLSILSWLMTVVARAKASADRVNDIVDTEIDLLDTKETGYIEGKYEGKIQFDSVSFRYPGSEALVLKNLSFTADARETVAIMGATGSGKTSLFQLIPRLFDIESGYIYLDDEELTHIPLHTLRKQIGYVPQEAVLFSGSIRENIAWGKEEASIEEIMLAAKHAQIHETIMQLPKQYETTLGQKGINLSGGQKQRLSIARALVRNPKILLLDDSTSALDLKTEGKLLHALKGYSCTTLIITQKISTAMEADKILLLDEGELIAIGTHTQLAETNALYQKIIQSQFGKEGLRFEAKS